MTLSPPSNVAPAERRHDGKTASSRSRRSELDVAQLENRVLFSAAPLPMGDLMELGEPEANDLLGPAHGAAPLELIFIDGNLDDAGKIASDLIGEGNEQVFLLDNGEDGLEQISAILREFEEVDAIHLLTHGDDGRLKLGDEWLDWQAATESATELISWRDALADDADILLYGCDVAASERGEQLLELLAELTKADIAASNDLTGHVQLGGDWELEVGIGDISTQVVVSQTTQNEWSSLLAGSVPDNTANHYFVFEDTDTTGGYSLGDLVPPSPTNPISWTIDSGADASHFSIGGVDSDELVMDDGVLDFDTQSSYEVVVRAVDGDSNVFFETINVHVGENLGPLTMTDEQRVNVASGDEESTDGRERGSHQAVATDDDGNHVIVWTANDSNGDGIFGQRFDADGNEVGGVFQVNTDSDGNQRYANVAMDASGRFVVSFTGRDSNGDGIFMRRFNTDGSAIDATDILVNAGIEDGNQRNASVAVNASGQIVFAWDDQGDAEGVFQRHFDMTSPTAAGELNTTAIQVSGSKDARAPSVDINDGGRIVVTWDDDGDLKSAAYDHGSAAKVISTFGINAFDSGRDAVVGVQSNGNFVVVFRNNFLFTGVWVKHYRNDGVELESEWLTGASGEEAAISIGSDDSFVVTYERDDADHEGVYAQKFDANASTIGGEFQVNQTTDGTQQYASVAALSSESFVVVWSGNGEVTGEEDANGVFRRGYGGTPNPAPTSLTLSNSNVDENTDTSSGFILGTLAANDPGDSLVYLVYGGPDADAFSITGDQLTMTAGVLDFESQDRYEVVVRVVDSAFNVLDTTVYIDINDRNDAPTSLVATTAVINENVDTSGGQSVLTLETVDQDTADSFTYSIVGGSDAALFSIGGVSDDELILDAGVLDHETKASYTVQVRSADAAGSAIFETVVISVADLNESPTAISPTGIDVEEFTDTTGGLSVGTLSATDPDVGDTFSFVVVGGPDAAKFSIGGTGSNELILDDGVVDTGRQASYTVIVEVTDSNANTHSQSIVVSVSSVDFSPTEIIPDATEVDENVDTTGGVSVATLTTVDLDADDSFTYSIVGGPDAAKFSMGGVDDDELILDDGLLDHETSASYTVVVRTEDSTGSVHDESITINVADLNEAPFDIDFAGAATPVPENTNTTSGLTVATMSTSDPDVGESIVYRIMGGVDAAKFSIGGSSGDELILSDGVLDFERQSTYDVRVRATDSGGSTYEESVVISVADLNESPTAITPDEAFVDEHTDTTSGVVVATLAAVDQDTGESHAYSIFGGTDAASFTLGGAFGNQLILDDGILNAETQASYSVVIRVTDSALNVFDETILVTVNDLNDLPTDISPNVTSVTENTDSTSGLFVSTLSTVDEDVSETFTYQIVGGADAAKFSMGGAQGDELILTDGQLDHERQDQYQVLVRVTDSGGATYEETLIVNIDDVNETPTGITPSSFALNENTNTTGGVNLGTLAAVDPDVGETFTYVIAGGVDAGQFSLGGLNNDQLIFDDGLLDFETQGTYTVIVRVTDSAFQLFDQTVVLNVNDLNEAPSVQLSNVVSSVSEFGTIPSTIRVADITVTDDALGDNQLRVVGADAGKFIVVNGDELHLRHDANVDYETQTDLQVRVVVVDGDIPSTSSSTIATIAVNDVNEQVQVTGESFVIDSAEHVYIAPGVLANDFDPEGQRLTVALVTQPAHGTVTLLADGSFYYVAESDFFFEDSFTYIVSDGVNEGVVGTVELVLQIPPPVQLEASAVSHSSFEEEQEASSESTKNEVDTASVEALSGAGAQVATEVRRSRDDGDEEGQVLIATAEVQIVAAFVGNLELSELAVGDVVEGRAGSVTTSGANGTLAGANSWHDEISVFSAPLSEASFGAFMHELNELRTELADETTSGRAIVGSSLVVTTSLSVGYVLWLVRGGVLLSSMLSSLPAWSLVDPLPVLGYLGNGASEGDDESLESLVHSSNTRRSTRMVRPS